MKTIEIKGETKLECLQKCRKREQCFDYVTKIHKVTIDNPMYKQTPTKRVKKIYIGRDFKVYYRCIMKLKEREG